MLKFYDFLNLLGVPHPTFTPSCFSIDQRFHYSKYANELGDIERKRLHDYLSSSVLTRQSYGNAQDADSVIAFSFGDSTELNTKLASEVEAIHQECSSLPCYVQQEIAKHLTDVTYVNIENDQYQTTADVARSACQSKGCKKVIVVAQSWHAQRCIETCEQLGLEVVALRVVEGFPAQDPQPWVRNPINWVLKESHREVATGYEISERFNLV